MHFIRLIRPLNLLIVIITMYGLGWYFTPLEKSVYNVNYGILSIPYFLLVISTTMIAAAGNIINDYFDVRADRINKPDRLIIGKFVKRRVAIVSHWGINFVAFCIAFYLSWKLDTFWYLFIHLLTINLLWFYSMYLKRRFLSGNLLIAILTALVTILVGYYFEQTGRIQGEISESLSFYPFSDYKSSNFYMVISIGLAGFAFVLNLAREIVKDMEDVEGDKKLNSTTLPIKLGYKKSKWIVAIVLFGCVIGTLLAWNKFSEIDLIAVIPIAISALLVIICFALLPSANDKKAYRRLNHLIKLAMVAGLLSPIYWKLLIIL